jgi:hypothetical protein
MLLPAQTHHAPNTTSFSDLISHHLHTSNGNAVIDAGHGDTITLAGVSVGCLTAGDFAF